MRAKEFITENSPRTLYHGTLKANLPSIMKRGLEPRTGAFTRHFYDDGPDLEELVFAASRRDIKRGLNSIIHYLKQQGIKPTPDNIIRYGAMVVIKDDYDEFKHRPHDMFSDYNDYPRQVEPGDFYTNEPVQATYILQNKKLRDLLRREGFDAWMGSKHPKLQQQNEAKFDYSIDDYLATPYDPGNEYRKYDDKRLKEPHRGPQEGKYLNLMLRGIKPISIFGGLHGGYSNDQEMKELFRKHIESGRLKLALTDGDTWYVTLPGEEWRAKKAKQLFQKLTAVFNDPNANIQQEKSIEAKIGMILGIPKESIRYFLSN